MLADSYGQKQISLNFTIHTVYYVSTIDDEVTDKKKQQLNKRQWIV